MKILKQNLIRLHDKSIKLLDEVFQPYKEQQRLKSGTVISNPIIHMYAEEDTFSEDGELRGFMDKLMFRVDVYDTKKLIKYTGESLHDGIDYYDTYPSNVSIFKDGSTMLMFYGDVEIGLLTSLCVYKHNLKER